MNSRNFSPASAKDTLVVRAVLTLALVLAACTNSSDNGITSRIAAVSIVGNTVDKTTASADVSVVAFDVSSDVLLNIPNSTLQQTDQCVVASLTNPGTSPIGQMRAGDALQLMIGAETYNLPWSSTRNGYFTPSNAPISYLTGDVARAVISGSAEGFPAAEISVRLAEPIVIDSMSTLDADRPLEVYWNATRDPGTAVILSLAYANPATSTVANEQVYCELADDGAHLIEGVGLARAFASPPELRYITITRWRTSQSNPDDRSLVHIVSTVQTVQGVP